MMLWVGHQEGNLACITTPVIPSFFFLRNSSKPNITDSGNGKVTKLHEKLMLVLYYYLWFLCTGLIYTSLFRQPAAQAKNKKRKEIFYSYFKSG